MSAYNLCDEEWIPVLYRNGDFKRVNIFQALKDAGRISQIAASNPMDRVALLRFLLAVVYWCQGNPPPNEEKKKILSEGQFPERWFSKLQERRDCFNLLGHEKRFYQYCKQGSGKNEKLSANYLIQEIPTGSNKWHFRHSIDEVNGLCPGCCAMGLLRLPMFATSGGRGKPPGINSKPPIYVMPVGVSLVETLLLSWREVSDLGTPAWEKPDMQLPRTGPIPLLMGFTWVPRRVWLDNPEDSEANCISCGRRERLIRLSVFAPIGSMKGDEDGEGRIWYDPHCIYGMTNTGDIISLHAGDALGSAEAAANQWVRVVAGVVSAWLPFDTNGRAWVVGFATVQNDKYLEAGECLMANPFRNHNGHEIIARLDHWEKEGFSLTRRLYPANKKIISRTPKEIASLLASIRPHTEMKVAEKFLRDGSEVLEQARSEYHQILERIAPSLSPGFTTQAVQRRDQIAGAFLKMANKPAPKARSPKHKKGTSQ